MKVCAKPYADRRRARLGWLGLVPAHWEEQRGKFFFREVDERSRTGSEELLSVSHKTGITPRSEKNITMFKAASYVGYKLARPDDIVVNTMWAWMAALGVSKHEGIVSSSYAVYRPYRKDDFVPEYLDLLLRTDPYKSEYLCRSTGIRSSRLRLYPDQFLDIPILRPPKNEQEQIVAVVRHKDRQIARFIRNKRQAIALLNEKKQAIIHRAVAQGLDADARVKPSGVEWLGDVPEHWEMVPLKFLSRNIQNGATPPTADESFYAEGTVPWFGPSSITADVEVSRPVRHLAESAFLAGKARLIRGPAILVVVIGATAGRMALLSSEGSTNQQITAFELREGRIEPELAIHQLRAAEIWLRATASTATIPILDSGTVSRLMVALPSRREQQAILEQLAHLLRPVDAALSRAHREIVLMREYRTRLIADVVTGKVDVRAAAASVPEHADELEALDEIGTLSDGDGVIDDELNAAPEQAVA